MFLLVNPPFASLHRPNLGLSLLKACLLRDGHTGEVFYADHRLADHFRLNDYDWVHADYEALTGEWLFSGFVRADWDERYLELMRRRGTYSLDQTARLRQARGPLALYLRDVVEEILARRPVVVGCSSTFQQNNAALAILKQVKQRAPEVVTVMGGANLEGELGEPVARFPWIDYVVSGEAEGSISRFYELCCRYGQSIPEAELPVEVATATRKSARGKIAEMDELPYPDFDDFFASLSRFSQLAQVKPELPLEGSRGCWWGQVKHCTFCGLNGSGMSYRAKSPSRLLDEIQTLSAKHSIRQIQMVDNIIAPKHLKELLPSLVGSDLRFFWEVKANLKGPHFELLRAAGVHWVQPGIESFADNVLTLMRKGQRSIQNVFILKAARENGIRLSWNLLVRHPGETIEDIVEQIELAHSLMHLQPPQSCCDVRPDRFSPLFAESEGLAPSEVYSYIYELEPADLRRIAYLFRLSPDSRPAAYRQRYAARIEALLRKVEAWRAAWQVPERRTLHFQDAAVRDRRWPGKDLVYSLSELERRILEQCGQPIRVSELVGEGLEAALERLTELRLCHRDETHVLSLVLNKSSDLLPGLVME